MKIILLVQLAGLIAMGVPCELACMTTGEKITLIRQRLDMSQGDLAKASGFQQARISLWESGKGRLYADQIARLATALKVPVGYLLDEFEVEPPVLPVGEIEVRVWEVVRTIGPGEAWERLVGKPWTRGRVESDKSRGEDQVADE